MCVCGGGGVVCHCAHVQARARDFMSIHLHVDARARVCVCVCRHVRAQVHVYTICVYTNIIEKCVRCSNIMLAHSPNKVSIFHTPTVTAVDVMMMLCFSRSSHSPVLQHDSCKCFNVAATTLYGLQLRLSQFILVSYHVFLNELLK